jgi:lipopolysaccharide/colanic/teichoic acid biosynthesis glycosyltransferase
MRRESGRPPYHRSGLKRAFDATTSAMLLLLLSPLMLLLAVLVRATMGAPVMFRQERIGRDGAPFRLMKFRSMRPGTGGDLRITARGDQRITRLGRLLRATKLDELPQLLNVLRGEMSIVGPRPEVPEYVRQYSLDQRRVLEARPGLTDPASIRFRDEEAILALVAPERRDAVYREEILPQKLSMNLDYVARSGFWLDVRLMLETAVVILRPTRW